MTAPVQAEGLSRTYRGPEGVVVALQPVDLKLARGAVLAVEGPSGGGKSTLLNLLGLLDRPSKGNLFINGTQVDDMDDRGLAEYRRRHIGFLFQDAGLIDRMTSLENVRLPMEYRQVGPETADKRAMAALEEVGMSHRVRAMVDTLSGGERQRVGLARLLAMKPDIILCDEPTASLDEMNSRLMVEHLRAAAHDGACIVCASHDPIVLDSADQRLRLLRGVASWPGLT